MSRDISSVVGFSEPQSSSAGEKREPTRTRWLSAVATSGRRSVHVLPVVSVWVRNVCLMMLMVFSHREFPHAECGAVEWSLICRSSQ